MVNPPHQHEPWGTLEELLLASAVNRHGTTNWDSISIELQNRFSQFSPFSLTPQDCRDKFQDLKKRFISQSESQSESGCLFVMLEELRKIRVEELRRDVQRRDVLIMSLEMKVKMLEDERQKSREAATDLETEHPDDKTEESLADDRLNRSLNESNSTSKKDDVRRENGVVREEGEEEEVIVKLSNKETGPIRTGGEPGRKEEYVNNKRRERKEKERKTKWGKMKKRKTGDSIDAWESVSETKQQQKQQSSDVQSSGSLSQKKQCRSSGEDPDELSPPPSPSPAKVSAVKSQPLLKFLEIIRSHRLGSLFERRLRSQESERYKKMIRVHVDLKTIHSRVVKGQYGHSIHRFFRDVLLLFNNAIIFFPKSSSEHIAALKLRPLVFKEIKDRIPPNSSSTLIGCSNNKRDSVIALPSSEVSSRKRDLQQKQHMVDVKKVTHGSDIKIYEKGMWKKGMKERSRLANVGPGPCPSPSQRSSRTSKHNGEVKHEYGGNELSSHDAREVTREKKETVTKKKKQGAVSFLKRMKQNSPSEATEEDVDVSDQEDSLKEEGEENTKQGRRERVTRSGSGNAKKAIGRPPKGAEPVKRRRDEAASGTGSGGKPRKRSRR